MPTTANRRVTALTRRFKALADPTRLQIIARLRGRERCVCELTRSLDVPQPLLSFHLRALKSAGLVRDRREGRWVYYALDLRALQGLETFLGETRTSVDAEPAAQCCD